MTDANGIETTDETHIENINPLRYRSYYLDIETGFYHLQTRYYFVEAQRMLNPDTIGVVEIQPDLYDKNLFAYCDNNPNTRIDANGQCWLTIGIMAIGGVVGGITSFAIDVAMQKTFSGEVNWKSAGVSAVSGFFSGAISASPLGVAGQKIAGGIIGAGTYILDKAVGGNFSEDFHLDELAVSTLLGVGTGKIGGKGANYKGTLNNAIRGAKQTAKREARRANQRYAQKAIASAMLYKTNTIRNTFYIATGRYVLGNTFSTAINKGYSKSRFLLRSAVLNYI